MKRTLTALSLLALIPSIAGASYYGMSFGETFVDTGNRNISVHTFRTSSPLVVGVRNNSPDYVRCSATFTHIPVIDETQSATIAPGKKAALVNRQGYLAARVDVYVKCA